MHRPHPSVGGKGRGQFAAEIDKLGVGQTWTDRGYVSTSTSPDTATSFGGAGGVFMKISTRQGVAIHSISSVAHEREVLLPRGSRFRLKSKEWRWVPGQGARLFVELDHVETN